MSRAEPRRSSLAGTSPVTPAAPPDTAPGSRAAAAGASGKRKVSFYQDPVDTDRMRGALLHTMAQGGPRTLSAFIDEAVMRQVALLEASHNGGHPFPPVGPRELPQGRPVWPV